MTTQPARLRNRTSDDQTVTAKKVRACGALRAVWTVSQRKRRPAPRIMRSGDERC